MIRKTIITGISTLAIASVGWTAEPNPEPDKERIGIASGAVLGGLAGGPLGVVFGAAFGGWLGDEFDEQRRERDDFEQRWDQARAEVQSLNSLVQGSERQLAQLTHGPRRGLKPRRRRRARVAVPGNHDGVVTEREQRDANVVGHLPASVQDARDVFVREHRRIRWKEARAVRLDRGRPRGRSLSRDGLAGAAHEDQGEKKRS